jgi:hypothetical protein
LIPRRRNILVVYAGYPTRATLVDGLYCFRRYCEDNVSYLNLRLRNVPRYILKIDFDLVIFHTLFFASRHDPKAFNLLINKALPLAECAGVKAMIPQDEFINAQGVKEFIRRFGIDVVFSAMPEREWSEIYGTIDRSRVRIHRVLAGYLDDMRLKKMREFLKGTENRGIDIGYRTAGRPPAWFGRHGLLKQQIAEVFSEKCKEFGLRMDISTSAADTLLGNEWYRFLCRCKYTIGVEGGTSIIDPDGSIKHRTEAYCEKNPNAGFEEIEKACFPALDGKFRGYAISPRHLEACATQTCQLLTEGDYNGILLPGRHYIAVKEDFSNLEEVLKEVKRDIVRKQIVDTAYQEIVESGKYTYRQFVDFVITRSLPISVRPGNKTLSSRSYYPIVRRWMRLVNVIDHAIDWVHGHMVMPLRQRLLGR